MFNLNFATALADLGSDAVFRVANSARPPAEHLFATLLPEVQRYDYTVKTGNMIVRSTMAGLAAMDSPYPPGGVVEMSRFIAEVAKIANEVALPERTLRELQAMLMTLQVNNAPTVETVQREALNFLDKVIVQAHLDTMEWLRSQALMGQINWTFNELNLTVDYGIPAGNKLATRSGNDAYGGSASKFWTDIRLLQKALRYSVRAFIVHPNTADVILSNDVNNLEVIAQSETSFRVRRLIGTNGTNQRPSGDARDSVEFIIYPGEAEVLDPTAPGQTVLLPFMPEGKILAVANNQRPGYRVGEGSTPNPDLDAALGYTHLAPTIEGGGRPGRWAELFVPERTPMKLNGRGVTNGLPVIEAPEKIAIATTDMPA